MRQADSGKAERIVENIEREDRNKSRHRHKAPALGFNACNNSLQATTGPRGNPIRSGMSRHQKSDGGPERGSQEVQGSTPERAEERAAGETKERTRNEQNRCECKSRDECKRSPFAESRDRRFESCGVQFVLKHDAERQC